MDCYYSNLIEGHHTHPVDIDRALAGDYSNEPEKRNLQLEARAHIDVQRKIDLGQSPAPSTSEQFILWVHKEFCQQLPPELLLVKDPKSGKEKKVVSGELRKIDVKIGRHIAPAPNDLGPLIERFASAYGNTKLPKIQRIIGVGASHHRLLWIHPFADGNGRVARLFSHAFLKELGIGSSLWSVSRGLARAVDNYKAALQAADEPRRGDLDGRGNLTQAGLVEFSTFFLTSCVDQVVFMESLFEPAELQRRMEIWCEEETRADRLRSEAGRSFAKLYLQESSHAAKHLNSLAIKDAKPERCSTPLLKRASWSHRHRARPFDWAFLWQLSIVGSHVSTLVRRLPGT